jgi:predicted nucleic acid-binding Zn ribbon protein
MTSEQEDDSRQQAEAWWDVNDHVRRYGRRGANPKSLQTVLNRLLARQGYNQQQAESSLAAGWRKVVPPQWAGCSRVKQIQRGVLEVVVANSAVLQQLTFQQAPLLRAIQQELPEKKIKQIRFRLS